MRRTLLAAVLVLLAVSARADLPSLTTVDQGTTYGAQTDLEWFGAAVLLVAIADIVWTDWHLYHGNGISAGPAGGGGSSAVVPEPAAVGVLGVGLVGLCVRRRPGS